MIRLYQENELEVIKKASSILVKVMKGLRKYIKPGIQTKEIDSLAQELIQKEGAVAAFKGYKGFPASICVSINEEIVHGIPGEKKINSGDILSLDAGINYNGYFSDAALTMAIGRISAQVKKLIKVSHQALYEGIKQARVNNHLSAVSYAIQNYVEKNGFSVVREFVGHGIGKNLHEEPEIPNFSRSNQEGPLLKDGMVLAIEPMVNMGSWESEILANNWTAVTKDRMPSAHFEHTVAVTDRGPEILTHGL